MFDSPIANVKQTRNILPQMLATVFFFSSDFNEMFSSQPSDRMNYVHDIVLAYADTTCCHESESWNKWIVPFSAPNAKRTNASDVFCVNGFESKNRNEIEWRKTKVTVPILK